MSYWENYYQQKQPDQIPWSGDGAMFFNNLWQQYNLPQKGNLLDVGCGRGAKTIYLAQQFNFKVWGFDISETAIKDAKDIAKKFKNKPIFFVSDATKIGLNKEINNINFDVIIDLVTTQFLTQTQKLEYLKSIKKHLIPGKTFYVFNTFVKSDGTDKTARSIPWVRKIAQSPEMIEKTYLKYFNIVDSRVKESPKGKVGTYITIAK